MLELYQLEECPFCRKVRRKLGDLDIDFVARFIPKDRSLRLKIEELSGQRGVPVLVDPDAGEVIPDSDRIVDYLEKKLWFSGFRLRFFSPLSTH
jgi:glutathione S-transferase